MNDTHLRSMETAVAFIESHLQDKINIADIASAVSYSLYHFCRVFNQTVHHPPYDYLIRRRLSAAAQQLEDSNWQITDIGFAYQFNSPESFSRAFRRMFGELPTQWRKQGIRDPRILMQPLTRDHLTQRNLPKFQHPTMQKIDALTVVGLMTIMQGDGDEETAVSELLNQFNIANHILIHHYPDYWVRQGKPTLVGALDITAKPPLVSQTIPPYTYASFTLPECATERPFLTDYIYQTWLPQSNYKLAASLELEQDQKLFIPITPEK